MSFHNCFKKFLLACFITSTSLFAQVSGKDVGAGSRNNSSSSYVPQNSWLPSFPWVGNFQEKEAVFSEINIGPGFLYFDDVTANFGVVPPNAFPTVASTPDKRDISYSKTPLFEYVIGYQFTNWFKGAISFLNQSNISMQSRTLVSQGTQTRLEFSSDLQLNAFLAKAYFELPWPLMVKTLAFTPYISGATGGAWQTWSNTTDRIFLFSNGTFIGTDIPFRTKTIPSIGALADVGLRVHSAYPNSNFSMKAGCKFVYWGQVRNLGMLNQQGSFKVGLLEPFRMKMLYSFSPYIGLNWNFPVMRNNVIAHRNANTHEVMYVSPKEIFHTPCITAQVNVGPNFLFFSELRGNLVGLPQELFNYSGPSIPLNRRLSYVKSPIIEYLLGYRVSRWLEMGISYQYQNETMITSRWFSSSNIGNFTNILSQFSSYLNLNALMAKFSVDLFSAVVYDMAFTPFISVGVGPSWQSWTEVKVQRTALLNGGFINNFLYLRDKIVTNASWMADCGIKMRNSSPNFLFSFVAGCRYNEWGQVRNIGKMSQQGGLNMGLLKPIRAKVFYSFTPYLGMEWDFPVTYNYQIQDRSIDRWCPYITRAENIQKRFSLLTQANVGPGILFFDKIRGNFAGNPAVNFVQNGSSPFKSHLRYNITPLYEFILGYRFFQWLEAAMSYQNQNSIYVSTANLVGFGGANGAKNQFRAELILDSFLLKICFELPYPLIFKGYAISPYIAINPGVGWQSWKNMTVYRTTNNQAGVGLSANSQSVRQKIIANFVWMAEGGFRVRPATPNFPFSGMFGCKYIQWGQTRNIGLLKQQANNFRVGLFKPFSIRVLGSVVPYVGLQWNF